MKNTKYFNYIKTKTVKVHVMHQKYMDMYNSKGYDIHESGDYEIEVKDLPSGSNQEIEVECSYCGRIYKEKFNQYEKHGRPCCANCIYLKTSEKMLQLYGVENCSQLNSVKEKKYKTTKKNYGVEHPNQSSLIMERVKSSNRKRYGKDFYSQTEEGREKFAIKFENINGVSTSSQQKHLCDLFNAELNKRFDFYFADLYIPEFNLIIEYDGSGHELMVKRGEISEEGFLEKQKNRDIYITKNFGIYIWRIVCKKDNLPDDKFLEKELNRVLKKFCKYDINEVVTEYK